MSSIFIKKNPDMMLIQQKGEKEVMVVMYPGVWISRIS